MEGIILRNREGARASGTHAIEHSTYSMQLCPGQFIIFLGVGTFTMLLGCMHERMTFSRISLCSLVDGFLTLMYGKINNSNSTYSTL